MAEKPVKTKQPDNAQTKKSSVEAVKPKQTEKPKAIQAKTPDKDKAQPRQPNRFVRWWRETVGELRKVSWPSRKDAWRLTYIVIIVMALTALFLGSLDFLFSRLIGLLVTL